MNATAKAWLDWITSQEGRECADFSTLFEGPYLENRLWRAFMAGAGNAIGLPNPTQEPEPAPQASVMRDGSTPSGTESQVDPLQARGSDPILHRHPPSPRRATMTSESSVKCRSMIHPFFQQEQ